LAGGINSGTHVKRRINISEEVTDYNLIIMMSSANIY
jgi:hypothetical protein